MDVFEPATVILDSALEQFQSVEMLMQMLGDDESANVDEVDDDEQLAPGGLVVLESERNALLFRVDIGPELGIPPTLCDQDMTYDTRHD